MKEEIDALREAVIELGAPAFAEAARAVVVGGVQTLVGGIICLILSVLLGFIAWRLAQGMDSTDDDAHLFVGMCGFGAVILAVAGFVLLGG